MPDLATTRLNAVSAVKLALLARQLRSSNDESAAILNGEPIAIIGVGCRLPGGASSPEAYWQVLRTGIDAVGEAPSERFGATGAAANATRWGGYLNEVDQFDAEFFGISAREAERLDPQQRIFLEVAMEALDDAGQTPDMLSGTQAGVFVASTFQDYAQRLFGSPEHVDAYNVTGAVHCFIANRLSYVLNLQGPSVALDTACSSSLVAVHLACQSLRQGESSLAIAAGVNVIASQEACSSLERWGVLSPTGSCKTFDASADGFVRSEGCGVVVLKRLADALADGDRIHAVIRGDAVNQDGRSTVMTAPNGLAQQQVVRQALARGGIDPADITYVETHGTGTVLGDPIEVEALAEVIGQPAPDRPVCVLGAAKTNLGHLEAAAGVAGLIKLVLCLEHEEIPPNLHFQQLNPHISLDGTRLVIPTETVAWPRGTRPRRAGVSSFGFGGTNAHVVVEEAPELPAGTVGAEAPRPLLLVLSGHNPGALRAQIEAYRTFLADLAEPSADSLAAICHTASVRRPHHDHRLAVVGASRDELVARLDAALAQSWQPGVASGVRASSTPLLAFVFSGQGPQWWAMGRELLRDEPVFRAAVTECDALLREHTTDWSLLDELGADEHASRLDQTAIAQPALFALQVGLAALWASWGVVPHAVVGHSVGEIAAAYVSGTLSLREAIRVVYHRARLMQAATGTGCMAACEVDVETAQRAIADHAETETISVAAINAPSSTVLSGETGGMQTVLADLSAQGVTVKALPVNYAFHSPLMAPFQAALVRELSGLSPQRATTRLVSTVTGRVSDGLEYGPDYWGRNVRQTVRFADAMQALADLGCELFVEVGPHPVLASSIAACLAQAGRSGTTLTSLRRQRPERETMLAALAELYVRGVSPRWPALFDARYPVVSLPNYAWQHERYWLEPTLAHPAKHHGGPSEHPLLGRGLRSPALKGSVFQVELASSDLPFLDEHRFEGQAILPAAAFVEAALAAGAAALGAPCTLHDLLLHTPLDVGQDQHTTVQVHVEPADGEEAAVTFHSLGPADAWKTHATGRLPRAEAHAPADRAALADWRSACSSELDVKQHYASLAARGIELGPALRTVRGLWITPTSSTRALASVALDTHERSRPYTLHPALLDGAFQALAALLTRTADEQATYLPVAIERVRVFAPAPASVWSLATLREDAADVVGDLQLVDSDGTPVAEIRGLRLRRASRAALRPGPRMHHVTWQAAPEMQSARANPRGHWLILADHGGVGDALGALIDRAGGRVTLVSAALGEARLEGPRWQVDPTRPEQIAHVLDLVPAPDHLVYLWALDAPRLTWTVELAQSQAMVTTGALHVAQAVSRLPGRSRPDVWLVTRGAQPVDAFDALALEQAPLWGFAATAALEDQARPYRRVDLDPTASAEEMAERLLCEVSAPDGEARIAYRGGARFAARVEVFRAEDAPAKVLAPEGSPASTRTSPAEPVRLVIRERGTLEHLHLVPTERRAPLAGEVEVRVHASGLNFRDVLNALGMYPGEPGPLGDEFVGEVVRVGPGVDSPRPGQIVLGMSSGSHASYVTTRAELVTPKPHTLSDEAAATLPITFLTAHYALHHVAQLRVGERVLIHAAAGGVGLAAVQVAQRLGAEIFATAGSARKRAELHGLGVRHVFDSRSLDFSNEIRQLTGGAGVDVVLNSLAGEFIPASLSVLAEHGRFLELGKTDIWDAAAVARVRPLASYSVIYLGDVARETPSLIHSMLAELVGAIGSGELRPLPRRVFDLEHATDAFRYMAQARQIGKVVLRHVNTRTTDIRPDATYLVTGAFGGIGRHVVRWLVERGARAVALTGRSGAATDEARSLVADLAASGVRVLTRATDIAVASEVERLIQDIDATMPPLSGIIHAAGIVDDALLINQESARFERVLAPKLAGAAHLYRLTADRPLDWCVVFSAMGATLGSIGQTAYSAANAFLDALAQQARSEGAHALSAAWGPWQNTGMTAALRQTGVERLERRGLHAMPAEDALTLFAHALASAPAHVLLGPIEWPAFLAQTLAAERASYASVAGGQPVPAVTEPAPTSRASVLDDWGATPPGRRRDLLLAFIRDQVVRCLGLSPGQSLSPRRPFNELGLDSLLAVEVRNTLASALECTLPGTLLFDYPTPDALADYLMRNVPALCAEPDADRPGGACACPKPSNGVAHAELDDLSDADIEALLLAELAEIKNGRWLSN